jgi:glutamate-1-semialdehyde 2,1-aminomutase
MSDPYGRLERTGGLLESALRAALESAGLAASVQRVGSMWTLFFSPVPVRSWAGAASVDRGAFVRFFKGMLSRGVLLPPSPFESAFVSLAHDDAAMAQTIEAAGATLAGMSR